MSTDNRRYLAATPIWRSLVHLCIPMAAGLSVGVVYNIINAGFIGALDSTPLLAALTFSLPVFALLMAVGGVFGVGGSTYVSRLLGHGDGDPDAAPAAASRVRSASAFTAWGALAAGAVVGVVGLLNAGLLAGLIGAGADAHAPTTQYIGALFGFAPFLVAAFALEQLVRAEGAAVASMTGLIVSTVANLVFDVVFIIGLGWGVLGAGLAIGLANVVMVAYYVWWLTRRSTVMSLALSDVRIDADLLRNVFGIGASELIMSSFMIVTGLVLNWVGAPYGDALLASVGLAQRIAQLPEMMSMGIYLGAVPLFAYAVGAGDTDRLRRGITGATLAIAGVTMVFSTAVFCFRDQVIGLFSGDAAVLADGSAVLTAMLVSTIFNGFTGLAIALFQATGQIRNATIMSIAQGVLFLPVILLGNAWFGLNGVVWSMTATELMTFGLALALIASGRRRSPVREPQLDAV